MQCIKQAWGLRPPIIQFEAFSLNTYGCRAHDELSTHNVVCLSQSQCRKGMLPG
ncbi:hypothetical protein GBA52_016475 [Prunus armeniaca]|nr:hypothetical protein GBA52_016475 [Prunus armeniaca]